jgi:hypothetical protein
MKTCVSILLALTLLSVNSTLRAQGVVITYQGRVEDNGTSFNGTGQFKFALVASTNNSYTSYWSNDGTSTDGGEPAAAVAVPVTNGLFTVALGDTGIANMMSINPSVFAQANLQLWIWFNDGINGWAALSPPQDLTPAPYAVVAQSVSGNFSAETLTLSGTLNMVNADYSTGVGSGALQNNTAGLDNTANGYEALYSNTNGSYNTANGSVALFNNTSGSNNTANGFAALYDNTTGYWNTAIGAFALEDNTNGYENTATGFYALNANTTGFQNTASGVFTLEDNTQGYQNSAAGFDALYANTIGHWNTANGAFALEENVNGYYNTANGAYALINNTNGYYNTANGGGALYENASGFENTASGVWALEYDTNGFNNIAVGFEAGSLLTAGNNNIEIGNQGIDGDNNTIRLGTVGTQTNAFIAGIYGVTAPGGVPVYVNSSGKLGMMTSSARFKQDIRGMDEASDVLLSLRPVTFRYKPELDSKGTPQFGLIAEEVDKVDPRLVARDDKNQICTVRYEAVNAMLLNEFLKEHRKVEAQEAEIQGLDRKVEEQAKDKDAEIQALQHSVAELKKMVQGLADSK